MDANVSSSSENLLEPQFFSNISLSLYTYCYTFGTSSVIYLSVMITNICFLFPLCILILHHGYQQWQKNGSSSFAATMSHSESFIFHLVTMELIGIIGSVVCQLYEVDLIMLIVGGYIYDFAWYAEVILYVLTCVERYLAVVHPITYRNMRNERGVRIRNISNVCVWLFCFVFIALEVLGIFTIISVCLLASSLTVVAFCSLAVLCVLTHPGPGEQSSSRKSVDPSKQRAFHIILAILGVLVVKLTFNITWEVLYFSSRTEMCVILSCCAWFNLPCNLVLPLLFLHRAGKCSCHKKSNLEEEQD